MKYLPMFDQSTTSNFYYPSLGVHKYVLLNILCALYLLKYINLTHSYM